MTVAEFRRRVEAAGMRPSSHRIGGGRDEAYCLDRDESGWSVFYQERGERISPRRHATRQAALDDLWARLERDPTSRQLPSSRLARRD